MLRPDRHRLRPRIMTPASVRPVADSLGTKISLGRDRFSNLSTSQTDVFATLYYTTTNHEQRTEATAKSALRALGVGQILQLAPVLAEAYDNSATLSVSIQLSDLVQGNRAPLASLEPRPAGHFSISMVNTIGDNSRLVSVHVYRPGQAATTGLILLSSDWGIEGFRSFLSNVLQRCDTPFFVSGISDVEDSHLITSSAAWANIITQRDDLLNIIKLPARLLQQGQLLTIDPTPAAYVYVNANDSQRWMQEITALGFEDM